MLESIKVPDSDWIVEVVGGGSRDQEFLYYLARVSIVKFSGWL